MTDSSNQSKKLHSQNSFNLVDSKKSLRTNNSKEQSGIDKNIHNIISNFESQNLNVINENPNDGELQITDSILMELEETNSTRKEVLNSPMELDLQGFDFDEILKSQVKLKSPVLKRNFENYNKINIKIADKFLKGNLDGFNSNFYNENNLVLKEEDIESLLENMQSQRVVCDQSKINIAGKTVEFKPNRIENERICKKLQVYRAVSLNYPSMVAKGFPSALADTGRKNNMQVCHSAYTTNLTQATPNETIGDFKPTTNSSNGLNRFNSEFQNLISSSFYFYNLYREKIEEMERLKTQVDKIESAFRNFPTNRCGSSQNECGRCACTNSSLMGQLSNYNNNNFCHENGVKLYTNEIKIVLATNEQISPNQNMSSIKINKEFFSQMEDIEALNLSLNSNSIISQINQINNSMNNINSQKTFAQDNSRSGFKMPMELKRETNSMKEGGKIGGNSNTANNNRNSFSTANQISSNLNNLQKFEENKNKLSNVNASSRKELINAKHEEFDQIFQNAKNNNNNNVISNNLSNQFVSGKNLEKPSKNNEENIDSSFVDINSSMDMKNIRDEEFDQFLKNAKNKVNVKGLGNDFTTGNKFGKINKSGFDDRELNANSNKLNNLDNLDNLESDLNLNDINDADFDNMLNNLKNKTLKASDLNIEFSKGNNISKISNKQFLEKKNSTQAINKNQSNIAMLTSDFICNNNQMQYKTNQRVLKLMSEMENETGEELCDMQEEEIIKEQIVKKEKLKINNSTVASNKPEIGIKRNFNDHIKNLTSAAIIEDSNRPKKIQKTGFNIDKKESSGSGYINPISNKTTMIKLDNKSLNYNSIEQGQSLLNVSKNKNISIRLTNLKEKIKQHKEHILKSINATNADKCQFFCLCMDKFLEMSSDQITEDILSQCLEDSCKICGAIKFISIDNFSSSFSAYFNLRTLNKSDPEKEQEIQTFFRYQFRYVSWKYYLLSKVSENKNKFSLFNLFKHIYNKYKIIHEEGRRSFLTKVAEKDSTINKYMTLQIFDIKRAKDIKNPNIEIHTLELTDGYRSVYSEISNTNPISNLINKNLIYPGMKLDIGLAKVEKTTDFEVFIQIHYNSISKANFTSKLGQSKEKKFLIKNIASLRDDGGEVSLVDVIVLKKYEYFVFDYNKKMKYSRNKFEKIIEQATEDSEKRHTYSVKKEDMYNDAEGSENEQKRGIGNKKIIGKNVQSENLNNVKGLNRFKGDKNYRNNPKAKKEDENNNNNESNEPQKSPYEGISYTFKIICVDSLLYYNYLSDVEKNSGESKENFDKNLKKSLKSKLMKKCTIEFQTKNLSPFENILGGSRYQIALLNRNKNNQNFNSYDAKNLKLKANDLTLIKEIKLAYKKNDVIYQNFLLELNKCSDIKNEDMDISEFIISNNFNYSKIIHEEFSFSGIYLNRHVHRKINPTDESNKDSEKFLFFVNKDNCLAIIKVHDENFFEMTKFTNSKSNTDQIFHFSNLNFQILYYFENFSTKKLTTFKEEKLNDKNFANKYVVLFMQTTPYTSFKIANSCTKHFSELKKKIGDSTTGKYKIYDEALLDDVTKSI